MNIINLLMYSDAKDLGLFVSPQSTCRCNGKKKVFDCIVGKLQ